MQLIPDLSLFVIMAIFLVNYLVVRKFFLQPINEILEERATEQRTAEELYEGALARFNEAAASMENQLHAAKREAAQVRDARRAEAASFRQQLVDRAGAEGKQIVSEADQRLSADVVAARAQISREAESLAKLAAERILGRAV
jgi:F-type H+-transporting ATPase subunit b